MAENDDQSSRVIQDEFEQLIEAYSNSEGSGERIKKAMWERFGRTGVTFISDMANFSSTSRSLGICHFLKMIYRTRKIVAPIIKANNALLL